MASVNATMNIQVVANRNFSTMGVSFNRGDVIPTGFLAEIKERQLLDQRWLRIQMLAPDSGGGGKDDGDGHGRHQP